MRWYIVVALVVAAGNASPLNDAQLQDHGPNHRNELETRGGNRIKAEGKIKGQKKDLDDFLSGRGRYSGRYDNVCQLSAAPMEENNFFNWEVTMTGPKGSKIPAIIGKEFSLTMNFTDSYPSEAPEIIFQDIPQNHPNIYADGTIDLYEVDFLGYRWTPFLDITEVLILMCSILKNPAVPYTGPIIFRLSSYY